MEIWDEIYKKVSNAASFTAKETGKLTELAKANNVEITAEQIINRYMSNPITSAIVCGGLEPFDSPFALPELIEEFRKYTSDDIVIYTGYREEELLYGFASLREAYDKIKQFKNIIIKFGRFVPNQQPHYDEVLGVKLISDNQYAERIS